jgi:hypothetical protein
MPADIETFLNASAGGRVHDLPECREVQVNSAQHPGPRDSGMRHSGASGNWRCPGLINTTTINSLQNPSHQSGLIVRSID